MSAYEVCDKVVEAIKSEKYDSIEGLPWPIGKVYHVADDRIKSIGNCC